MLYYASPYDIAPVLYRTPRREVTGCEQHVLVFYFWAPPPALMIHRVRHRRVGRGGENVHLDFKDMPVERVCKAIVFRLFSEVNAMYQHEKQE